MGNIKKNYAGDIDILSQENHLRRGNEKNKTYSSADNLTFPMKTTCEGAIEKNNNYTNYMSKRKFKLLGHNKYLQQENVGTHTNY